MTPNNFREKANLRLAGSGRYTTRARRVQGAWVWARDSAIHYLSMMAWPVFLTNAR